MENIAIIIMFVGFIATIIRTTFFDKMRKVIVLAAIIGILIIILEPFAIEQNKMFLTYILSTQGNNITAIIIIECILFIGINLEQLQNYFDTSSINNKLIKIVAKALEHWTGLLFIGSIYYFEVQIFNLGLQFNFLITAIFVAIAVFLLIILLNYFIRKALPMLIRLELVFLLYIIQFILAIFYI
jgi:hypothetical protein